MSGSKLLSSKGDEGESEIFHHIKKVSIAIIFYSTDLLQLSTQLAASPPKMTIVE